MKKLSWLVAVVLFVGAPRASAAEETPGPAPKAKRKTPTKTAPSSAWTRTGARRS